MTYNIRVGIGIDNRQSLARIADVIRASGAQVVCLQEVGRRWPKGRFKDQPEWLGERLEMAFIYQPNLQIGPSGFGNLVLSKLPVEAVKSHHLTSVNEQRGLLEVRLVDLDRHFTVFCTHWGLKSEERAVQSAETAMIVKAVEGPKILCGDLNDYPESRAVKGLMDSSGLHDLAAEAGCNQFTFPSNTPSHRIDYILGSVEFTAAKAQIINTPASDHLPVLVEV